MDFLKHFAVRFYAFVLVMIFVFSVSFVVPAQAASLHTFKQYAAMTEEQQNKVWVDAAGVVFKDALTRKDDRQVFCLRKTLSLKYGPKKEVLSAHAVLQKKIEIGIEIERKSGKPNSRGRVEYLIGNHLHQVCPPSLPLQEKVEYHYYGPPIKKVMSQPNFGVTDKPVDLSGCGG